MILSHDHDTWTPQRTRLFAVTWVPAIRGVKAELFLEVRDLSSERTTHSRIR